MSTRSRRTRTLNKIHRIINRHNLIWNYPTKSFQTQAGRRWLEKVKLPEIDRVEWYRRIKLRRGSKVW